MQPRRKFVIGARVYLAGADDTGRSVTVIADGAPVRGFADPAAPVVAPLKKGTITEAVGWFIGPEAMGDVLWWLLGDQAVLTVAATMENPM